MLKRLWGKLLCKLLGHRRGKLTGKVFEAETNTWHKAYYCQRCNATWHRQIKQKVEVFTGVEAGPLPKKALDIIEGRIKAATEVKQAEPRP